MKKSTPHMQIPQHPFSIIEAKIRGRIRETIEDCLNEKLEAALRAGRHERADGRRGYRCGHKPVSLPIIPSDLKSALCRARTGSEPPVKMIVFQIK